MRPAQKIAFIVGGYLLAFLCASFAVVINAASTSKAAGQASAGMSAFGDIVLFVSVFGAVALLPTGAAFFIVFSKAKTPNKAPEPTPGSVTPRATEGDSK